MTLTDTTYSLLLAEAVRLDVERDAAARAARRARQQATARTAEAGAPSETHCAAPAAESMISTAVASDGGLDLDPTTPRTDAAGRASRSPHDPLRSRVGICGRSSRHLQDPL